MGDIAGTIRKLLIDGLPFDTMADADITEVGSQYLNESLPTSGRNMRKMTKRPQTREGFVIACNPAEQVILKNLADSRSIIPLSYTRADGSQFRAPGWIEFESLTTMENRATVKLHEQTDWQVFVA